MNRKLAPKSVGVEVADSVPRREKAASRSPYWQGGRRNFRGWYLRHASEGVFGNQGDPVGFHHVVDSGGQALQSKDLARANRKSYWLIVLRGREIRLHGEAASDERRVLRQHGLHSMGERPAFMPRKEHRTMTTALERIADKARREPTLQFTSLAHHLTPERLWQALHQHADKHSSRSRWRAA